MDDESGNHDTADQDDVSEQAPDVPAQIRELAMNILAEHADSMPFEVVDALRGLLNPNPTAEQFMAGINALEQLGVIRVQRGNQQASGDEAPEEQAILRELDGFILRWYRCPTWPWSRQWLTDHLVVLPEDTEDQLRTAANRAREIESERLANQLAGHMELLARARRFGVEVAYREGVGERAFAEESEDDRQNALIPILQGWINTPDWQASCDYLALHPELLTDEAEAALERLLAAATRAGHEQDQRVFSQHMALLWQAIRQGIYQTFEPRLNPPEPPAWANDEIPERVRELIGQLDTPALQEDQQVRLATLSEALDLLPRTQSPTLWAALQNNKGNALATLGERLAGEAGVRALQEAIAAYEKALTIRDPVQMAPQHATTQNNKGAALQTLGERLAGEAGVRALQEAIAAFDVALTIYDPVQMAPDHAMTQNNKGNALATLGERLAGEAGVRALQEAIAAYEKALALYSVEFEPGDYRRTARALARSEFRLALRTHAREAYQTLLEAAWEHVTRALAVARQLELRASSLDFRQEEWAENASLYTLAATLEVFRGNRADAIALLEAGRGRGLAEVQTRRGADLTHLHEDDRMRYLEALATVQQIEALGRESSSLDRRLALAEAARTAAAQLEAVVVAIREYAPDFLAPRTVSAQDLAGSLQRGEVLVYLTPQDAGTLLMVLQRSGRIRVDWLAEFGSDAIFQLAVQRDEAGRNNRGYLPAALAFRDTTPLDQALDALLPRLGDHLMRRVAELCRECGASRAVLVPGGMLAVLPLHAATYVPLACEEPTAPGGRRYFCDGVLVRYAPSGAAYVAARARAEQLESEREVVPWAGFVVGNPKLTSMTVPHWQQDDPGYLPFATEEAIAVASMMREPAAHLTHVSGVIGERATWRAVVDGLNSASIVHLATHAYFHPDEPMRSAIRVAPNASLRLSSLLDQQEVNLQRVRLAVLSACQSGLGDFQRLQEEAVGLLGALLMAGAAGVVGTLWPVYDRSTLLVMRAFMHRFLLAGQEPEVALRNATRVLRDLPDLFPAAADEEPATAPERSPDAEAELAEVAREWAASCEQLTQTGAEVEAGARAGAAQLTRTQALADRTHTIHWAPFVFYGA